MKKRFSDQQIISILREAKAGVSALELYRKHAISVQMPRFTHGVRSRKAHEEENTRLKKLLAEALLYKEALQVAPGQKY